MLRGVQGERCAMGILVARTRLEASTSGVGHRGSAWSVPAVARRGANFRRAWIETIVSPDVSSDKRKPSARGPAIPKADRTGESGNARVVMGRLGVRAARGLTHHATKPPPRSLPPRNTDIRRSARANRGLSPPRRCCPGLDGNWPPESGGRTPGSRGARHWPADRNGGYDEIGAGKVNTTW